MSLQVQAVLAAPIATTANRVNAADDEERNFCVKGEWDGTLTRVSLSNTLMGDFALQRIPLVSNPDLFPLVEQVDFSRCELTLDSLDHILAMIQKLPKLQCIHLTGNFKFDFEPFDKATRRGRELTPRVVKFVDSLCDTYERHPTLTRLVVDAWLVQRHGRFQAIRKKKEAQVTTSLLSKRVVGIAQTSGNLARPRDETMVHFNEVGIDRGLLNAAKQVSNATESQLRVRSNTKNVTSIKELLLDIQLTERAERDRIVRGEARLRSGSLSKRLLPVANTQQQAAVSRQTAAMGQLEELEDEIRQMIEQRQCDAFDKLCRNMTRKL